MDLKSNASVAEFFHDACRPTPSATRVSTRPSRPSATWSTCSPTSPSRHLTTSRSRSSSPRRGQLARRARPPAQGRRRHVALRLGLLRRLAAAQAGRRRLLHPDGRRRVQRAGALLPRQPNSAVFGEVYDELRHKFPRFVDVFAEVAEETDDRATSAWCSSTSAGCAPARSGWSARLRAQGVIPPKGELQ